MEAIASAKAKSQFSELIHRVKYGGESFTITSYGRAVARLVPVNEDASITASLASPAPPGVAVSAPTAGADR